MRNIALQLGLIFVQHYIILGQEGKFLYYSHDKAIKIF